MLLSDIKLDTTNKTISHSALATYRGCKAKSWYNRAGIYPIATDSDAITFGSWVHKGLAEWYATKKINFLQFIAAMNKAGVNQNIIGKSIACLKAYKKIYAGDMEQYDCISCEERFSTNLRRGYALVGVKDAILRDKQTKETFIFEHKTKSFTNKSTADAFLQILTFDQQALLYYIHSADVHGMMYNLIRNFSQHRQKKDESFADFCRRMEAHYEDPANEAFFRVPLKLTNEEIPNVKAALNNLLKEFETFLKTEDFRPEYRDSGACYDYNTLCPYLSICATGVIDNNFKYKGKICEYRVELWR